MSVASEFKTNYSDANDLMIALDDAEISSNQDWENETTTWYFEDDSQIVVSSSIVKVKD